MTIWLDIAARAQIEREARRHRLRETGGPLFGFGDENSDDVVIVGAGGPGLRARHRPRSFRPDRDAMGRAIERVHEASAGRYGYIGSWHTHPLGRPVPSSTDIGTASEMAADEEADVPRPLLLIQATRPTRKTLRDSDLCAYRWRILEARLTQQPLAVVSGEHAYPLVAIDWDEAVR